MKYYKQYKDEDREIEITKEEARRSLDGWWNSESLDEIFGEDKGFRLYTPYCDIWTETADGLVPIAGFYGTVG